MIWEPNVWARQLFFPTVKATKFRGNGYEAVRSE